MGAIRRTTKSAPPKLRRTWPQRLLIAAASVAGVACFVTAGLVYIAQQALEDRTLVALEQPPAPSADTAPGVEQSETGQAPSSIGSAVDAPPETFPQAEPGARNFLITGADNNSCIDPDSPYAGGFGDRGEGFGERSDTVMMWRVNADTKQVAVLSFPRDLWVSIDGQSRNDRINAAYDRDDPTRLIRTIEQNFEIRTDHFVQIDFCAFELLVEAVGGVAVPFDTPVRDGATGLFVPEPGCFTFTGEHALAYVRSRKLEFQNADGIWKKDESSDLGRIARQQDFIRRVADALLANAFSPSVVRSLYKVSSDYIVTDKELDINRILELSSILQGTNPAEISTYQIESVPRTIQGKSVLEPRTGGDNMQAILAIFRGEATLAGRPEQVFEATTGTATPPATTVPVIDPEAPTTTSTETNVDESDATSPDESTLNDTVPEVEAESNTVGVVPNPDISCS